MSSKILVNSFYTNQNIWDGDCQAIEEDDCTPQIPNATRQFMNTLKDNKGKVNKKDFEDGYCNTNPTIGPCGQEEPSTSQIITKNSEIRLKYKKRWQFLKPKTHYVSLPTNWIDQKSDKKELQALRRVPSSDILRSLLP
ncbi:unnamed protein product [Moneuplotes crassus]|uniref:Uncharacterized protein n=1 Tax=Euplotes crassus TaxID=5936 RepID=A0AAD1ULR4_EUPCR|nr:unnamed protein product [Moneuplotes crassus]